MEVGRPQIPYQMNDEEITRILARVNTSLEEYQVQREANYGGGSYSSRISQIGISVIFGIATAVETYYFTQNHEYQRILLPILSGCLACYTSILMIGNSSNEDAVEDNESTAGQISGTQQAIARHLIERSM